MGFREVSFHRDDDGQREYKKEEMPEKGISGKRGSLRVPMNVPARFYRQEDRDYQNPQECVLVEIGVDGACVDSKYRYEKNKVLCLRVELKNVRSLFLMSQIIRIDETESEAYRYGVLFAQIWDDELQQLKRVLEKLRQ